YWSHSEAKKGYSGVAVFSKTKPLKDTYGIGISEFDDEGRTITLEYEDFFLIACYIPNAGSKLERLDYKVRYNAAMEAYIRGLEKKKPIIWTGDLNVAHKEIDLARPKTNQKSAGFTPEERADFERILNKNSPPLIDTWRHLHPDQPNGYTYYSYRFQCRVKGIGWRLDYFVVSEKLMPRVVDSVIRSEAYGASDHVPIVLVLKKKEDSDEGEGK
ncbi:hypothetical protein HK102_007938, partial [Quaeritorhiza haematococci]